MKKVFLFFSFLLPYVVLGQAPINDYIIYSKFLKYFQADRKMENFTFVINETPYFTEKYGPLSDRDFQLNDFLDELRAYSKDKNKGYSDSYATFKDFTFTLIKDTLWFPVMTMFDKQFHSGYKIVDHFSPDLQIAIINKPTFDNYFRHMTNDRQIDRAWIRFHKKYSTYALLTELSKIASDGQRALFYFSFRCNGLCGEGDLVFFEKENDEWKCLGKFPLWFN